MTIGIVAHTVVMLWAIVVALLVAFSAAPDHPKA